MSRSKNIYKKYRKAKKDELKLVCSKYKTRFYPLYPFYKPISLIIELND